jgi:hypothetical protein
LLADTDGDGQSDGEELSCGADPLDAASVATDTDADGLPDCLDADDDGDGQADADEIACGADPTDPASQAPDFDGDLRPDCVDADDDGDTVADAADQCPATPLVLGNIGFAGCDSGVPDVLLTDPSGCSVSQWIERLAAGSRTKGQLVKSVDKLLLNLQKQGLLLPPQKDAVKSCVVR